jgi:hypothetical protein
MKLTSIFLLTLLITSGCSSLQDKPRHDFGWPKDLPTKEYFVQYYYDDANQQQASTLETYLLWVKRFYLGWELYQRGWLQATDELVESIAEPGDKIQAQEKAFAIGKLVAAEWAKDKRFRVINTRHLSIWGNALNESTLKDEQLLILDQILNDASTLLERGIQPRDIVANRYYEPEPFAENFQ